jgi:hypothetical protein
VSPPLVFAEKIGRRSVGRKDAAVKIDLDEWAIAMWAGLAHGNNLPQFALWL